MKGITPEWCSTLGSVELTLCFGEKRINVTFQVVENEFPIPGEGILGKKFLEENNAIVDFKFNELKDAVKSYLF